MLRLVATLVIAFVSLQAAPAAAAGDCPDGTEPTPSPGGYICIPVVDPGGDGGGGDGGGGGVEVPCNYFVAEPQPPASDPVWGGHTLDEGTIYVKDCEDGWGGYGFTLVFISNGPPNPADLARRALDQLELEIPDIQLAPSPPAKTYVGLETWLWMPSSQWTVLRKSVAVGGTAVSVVATPVRVRWNMGAGSTTCGSAGREWVVGQMSDNARTSCSFTYKKVSDFEPNKKFKVTSTIAYTVDWTCSGSCLATSGTLGDVDGLPGTVAIRVAERQSVVVSGGNN